MWWWHRKTQISWDITPGSGVIRIRHHSIKNTYLSYSNEKRGIALYMHAWENSRELVENCPVCLVPNYAIVHYMWRNFSVQIHSIFFLKSEDVSFSKDTLSGLHLLRAFGSYYLYVYCAHQWHYIQYLYVLEFQSFARVLKQRE